MNKNPITIQHFQDEATKQAEITNDTSRPIFEIITHRYRASAWKKFDVYNLQNQPLPKN